MLDVRRVHVDAAHDDHVVAPAAQAADSRRRPPAAAGLEGHRADVARAVAQEGHRLLRERREDELALFALWQDRARLRIDHLDDEVVLVHVQAVARLDALRRDTRAAHLRESVEVDRPQSWQRRLDLRAQPFRPRLSAEQAELELQRRRVDARVLHGLCDHDCVRGRRDEHLRAEVVQEHAWRADIPPETGTTGAPIRSAPWWKPWPPVKSP